MLGIKVHYKNVFSFSKLEGNQFHHTKQILNFITTCLLYIYIFNEAMTVITGG